MTNVYSIHSNYNIYVFQSFSIFLANENWNEIQLCLNPSNSCYLPFLPQNKLRKLDEKSLLMKKKEPMQVVIVQEHAVNLILRYMHKKSLLTKKKEPMQVAVVQRHLDKLIRRNVHVKSF